MQTELSRFKAAVEGQPELAAGLRSLSTAEGLVAYANERGFQFTRAELADWVEQRRAEIGEAELANVVGGASSFEQARAAGVGFFEALYWSAFLKE